MLVYVYRQAATSSVTVVPLFELVGFSFFFFYLFEEIELAMSQAEGVGVSIEPGV